MIVKLTVAWFNETKEYLLSITDDPRSFPDVHHPDFIKLHSVRAVHSAYELKDFLDTFKDGLPGHGLTRQMISNFDDLEAFQRRHFKTFSPATA